MSYQELSIGEPVARKDHKCTWCAEAIPKGEKHVARSYKFEGDFNSDRLHNECSEAMELVDWHYYDGGFEGGRYKRGTTQDKHGEELMLRKRDKK